MNKWHVYSKETGSPFEDNLQADYPKENNWSIVCDASRSTFTGKTIALKVGYTWTFLDNNGDYDDTLITHWMELPPVPQAGVTLSQEEAVKWNKFPLPNECNSITDLPPEGVELFVIDRNRVPIVFNIATYSMYNGWKLHIHGFDDMKITDWYALPDNPKPTPPTAGWNRFPEILPLNEKTILVAAIEGSGICKYFVCANWKEGRFYVDFNDYELDNEDVIAWKPIDPL